jgi:hypothetical protein
LLASIRELLLGYERVMSPIPSIPPRPTRRRRESPAITVSAGPFPSTEAVHEFEQAVSRIPGVREVAVREYEGADRAVIEVRLDHSNT